MFNSQKIYILTIIYIQCQENRKHEKYNNYYVGIYLYVYLLLVYKKDVSGGPFNIFLGKTKFPVIYFTGKNLPGKFTTLTSSL